MKDPKESIKNRMKGLSEKDKKHLKEIIRQELAKRKKSTKKSK